MLVTPTSRCLASSGMLRPSTDTSPATSNAPLMISSTLMDPRSRRCRLSATGCLANWGYLRAPWPCDIWRVIVTNIVRLLVGAAVAQAAALRSQQWRHPRHFRGQLRAPERPVVAARGEPARRRVGQLRDELLGCAVERIAVAAVHPDRDGRQCRHPEHRIGRK